MWSEALVFCATNAIHNGTEINKMDSVVLRLKLGRVHEQYEHLCGLAEISLKPETTVYLAGTDQSASKGVTGHNVYGKRLDAGDDTHTQDTRDRVIRMKGKVEQLE